MVVAKTEAAHWHLYEQFARRSTDKRYLALVHGNVSPSKGLIDLPLGRHPRDPTKFAVVAEGSGKPSQTEYIVRESYQGFTLVEVKLLTGRQVCSPIHTLLKVRAKILFSPQH
jgi:23S rRNA pseudouridine1911/1915/1917 synthase